MSAARSPVLGTVRSSSAPLPFRTSPSDSRRSTCLAKNSRECGITGLFSGVWPVGRPDRRFMKRSATAVAISRKQVVLELLNPLGAGLQVDLAGRAVVEGVELA